MKKKRRQMLVAIMTPAAGETTRYLPTHLHVSPIRRTYLGRYYTVP